MAKETKRRSSKTKSAKRRTPAKRTTGRRKKKGTFKKDLIIFFSVVLLVAVTAFGYFLGKNNLRSEYRVSNTYSAAVQNENRVLLENLEKIKQEKVLKEKRERDKKRKEEEERLKKEEAKKELSAELKKTKQNQQEEQAKKLIDDSSQYPEDHVEYEAITSLPKGSKPKLVIIIDDISSKSQLKHIDSLGMKITPSIFPPFKSAPHSHMLAEGRDHYMIHLPMESGKVYDRQAKTLMIHDSKETIEERVKEIRVFFPTAKYVNNHTGSRFTGDYKAMETLYNALQKEGFVFVDSRTTAATKVPKITKKYAHRYLARDIFLDNRQDIPYIHHQLSLAVKAAKKRGYAIAIGHPHRTTVQALAKAKHILKEVELVYIDELYRIKDKK